MILPNSTILLSVNTIYMLYIYFIYRVRTQLYAGNIVLTGNTPCFGLTSAINITNTNFDSPAFMHFNEWCMVLSNAVAVNFEYI